MSYNCSIDVLCFSLVHHCKVTVQNNLNPSDGVNFILNISHAEIHSKRVISYSRPQKPSTISSMKARQLPQEWLSGTS